MKQRHPQNHGQHQIASPVLQGPIRTLLKKTHLHFMCSCLDSRLILALEIDPASGRSSFDKEYKEETIITNGFSRAV